MKCPRCETTILDERDRDGIVVDVCSSCRGIWLDRGELEKLITQATQDLEGLAPPPARSYDERRSDSGREHRHDHHRHPKRKRSWLESLGDIFD